MTRARVPASVESSPPLYVPRESLDDMTRDRSDKFTPGLVKQMRLKIMFRKERNPPTNDAIYVTGIPYNWDAVAVKISYSIFIFFTSGNQMADFHCHSLLNNIIH